MTVDMISKSFRGLGLNQSTQHHGYCSLLEFECSC